jgi:hypothetical protein
VRPPDYILGHLSDCAVQVARSVERTRSIICPILPTIYTGHSHTHYRSPHLAFSLFASPLWICISRVICLYVRVSLFISKKRSLILVHSPLCAIASDSDYASPEPPSRTTTTYPGPLSQSNLYILYPRDPQCMPQNDPCLRLHHEASRSSTCA